MIDNGDKPSIIPGDLVIILGSCSDDPVPDCPPGLVLEISYGQPNTGHPGENETMICSILWRGFIDKWVSIEWLQLVSREF
jgi:hypothetical protein